MTSLSSFLAPQRWPIKRKTIKPMQESLRDSERDRKTENGQGIKSYVDEALVAKGQGGNRSGVLEFYTFLLDKANKNWSVNDMVKEYNMLSSRLVNATTKNPFKKRLHNFMGLRDRQLKFTAPILRKPITKYLHNYVDKNVWRQEAELKM